MVAALKRRVVCGLAALVALNAHGRVEPESPPPNLLVILADDLGIECLSSYGGTGHQTPHLDRLVREGMRFTQCFSNPYCSPSRASLLTGRYSFQHGIKEVIYHEQRHKDLYLDAATQPSFARQLQQVGYTTAIAGKWQLEFLHQRNSVKAFGFDQYQLWQIFRPDGSKTTRFREPHFNQNGTVIADEIAERYGPDVNVDFLIDFMRTAQKERKPFLAYHTSLLPHFPWVPTPDSTDQSYQLPNATHKGNPTYFPDMVTYLDQCVGRLLAAVDELGIADNTLVMFLADNGTDQQLVNLLENGKKVKGGKGSMTDRGTHVPLIVRWPGKVQPGSTCNDLIDFSDLLPTLVELGGAQLPSKSIHGRSFLPHLANAHQPSREWVHVQDKTQRHLRTHDFILNDKGQLRPVVELWRSPAPVLRPPYHPDAVAAKMHLEAAFRELGP